MKYLTSDLEHQLGIIKQLEDAVKDLDTAEYKDSIVVLILDKAINELFKHIAL